MAQDFSLRHPLVAGHGNFGSPDFGPAASRYTECRLDPLAMVMLQDIDEETVDFVDNYSGEFQQPVVLPARFPNLLVNGSQGIAVGMATNIPPHNLGEAIDAVVHLIDNPEATPDDLMQFVKGPDFPTGGLIMGRAGIMDAYRTGRGSIRVRARTEIVEGTGRQRDRIVVTEMPYQTSISATAARSRSWSSPARSRASRTSTTSRRPARPAWSSSSRRTRRRSSSSTTCTSTRRCRRTSRSTPWRWSTACRCTLNLVQMLQAYVDHQVDVIRRRSQFRLDKKKAWPTWSRACSRPSTSSTRSSPSSGRPTTGPRPAPG